MQNAKRGRGDSAPLVSERTTVAVARFLNMSLTILIFFILPVSLLGCGEGIAIQKGKGLLASGDYQGAVTHFQRLLDTAPENPEIHYQLGLAYLQLDQQAEALESLRTAARYAPQRLDIQLALGETYMTAGHDRFALNSFLRILQNSEREDWIKKIGTLTGDNLSIHPPDARLCPNP